MNPKQQRLIKDIALLFVKYDLKDWETVLDSLWDMKLGARSELQKMIVELAHAGVKEKPFNRPVARKATKRATSPRKPLSNRLVSLKNALISREVFKSQLELRQFAVVIGLKESLPSQRSDAIDAIIEFLSTKTDTRVRDLLKQSSALVAPKTDYEDEFARWAAVILKAGDS